jgi:outer membrane lipoprotein LolB
VIQAGRRAALSLLVVLGLVGCATTARPPVEGAAPWTSGRLSVRIESDPPQNVTAGFELRGDGQSGELRLNSPLGNRLATARWSPSSAVLADSQGEQLYANLDDLSRRALGEALPLAALPDWLAGRPWPQAPHRSNPAGFEQLGWQVSLGRRAEGFVEASRAAPPAVLVRVKLDDPS